MQKIKLIDLKKLPKASTLVHKEAEALLKEATEAMAARDAFFRQAGISPEDVDSILAGYQMSDEAKQQLSLWKAQFYAEMVQAKARRKKEMKLAERLLMPKGKRAKSEGKQRCTRIF